MLTLRKRLINKLISIRKSEAAMDTNVLGVQSELSNLHNHVTCFTDFRLKILNEQLYYLKKNTYFPALEIDPFALNGQFSKHLIFQQLLTACQHEVCIETGTYKGGSTDFFANYFSEVISVEINKDFYNESKLKLSARKNIRLINDDSGKVIPALMQDQKFASKVTFAYLDAHWYKHCPLNAEIDTIFSHNDDCIIMIDDFHHPYDEGFGYDKYDEFSLTRNYITPTLQKHNAVVFYPTIPSWKDHMIIDILKPRGTIVLAKNPVLIDKLKTLDSISLYE